MEVDPGEGRGMCETNLDGMNQRGMNLGGTSQGGTSQGEKSQGGTRGEVEIGAEEAEILEIGAEGGRTVVEEEEWEIGEVKVEICLEIGQGIGPTDPAIEEGDPQIEEGDPETPAEETSTGKY